MQRVSSDATESFVSPAHSIRTVGASIARPPVLLRFMNVRCTPLRQQRTVLKNHQTGKADGRPPPGGLPSVFPFNMELLLLYIKILII